MQRIGALTAPAFCTRAAAVCLIGSMIAGATSSAASTGERIIEERVAFAYKTIRWHAIDARAKLEADFRRAASERNLGISKAEIAGAAAAAASGVMHEDSWEQQTIIQGCGPAKQFCFVITCDRCSK